MISYDDGNKASVVIDRSGPTVRNAAPGAASVSDLGDEVLADRTVYAVGRQAIYSFAPTAMAAGATVTFTVSGRGFVAGTTFAFSTGFTYSILSLAWNQVTMSVTAPIYATSGNKSATVQVNGCQTTLASAFTVGVTPRRR